MARIYCTHETQAAFLQMWSGLWDTVEKVTRKFVHFRFIDWTGICAILVDGCKPQVDACGDDLLNQILNCEKCVNVEWDPQIIVQHIIWTCWIHLVRYRYPLMLESSLIRFSNRKFEDLAKSCPDEVMDHIRGFPFLETHKEVNEFIKWCENSEHKKI